MLLARGQLTVVPDRIPQIAGENPSREREARGPRSDANMSGGLLEHRIVFVGSGIDEQVAHLVVSTMLLLDARDPAAPIELYINSAGGSVLDGLAIYDTMQLIRAPVATYCLGCAASMGAVLLAAGTPGMRHATPNARIMIHQVSTAFGVSGSTETVRVLNDVMASLNSAVAEILSRHTGQPLRRIRSDMRRTRWFTAEEARKYGIVDVVLSPKEERKGGGL
jgi:ATP-dependent Clp protease protease subunit